MAAVVLAMAALVAAAVLKTHHPAHASAPPSPHLALAAPMSAGRLLAAPPAGQLGPEQVPIAPGRALAPAGFLAPGQSVDGISSAPLEQLAFHIHAHLTIFVDGVPRSVPYAIGITPPLQVDSTPAGPFVGGAAYAWLHTHAADGIIHIESPVQPTFTLGDFFDVWGQPLGSGRVGPAARPVIAFFNGRRYIGELRQIPLVAHAQIQLDVGRPIVAPEAIHFPHGL